MTTFGRRGFLGSLLGALAVSVAPVGRLGRAFGSTTVGPAAGPAEVIASFFADADAAARIGAAYLSVVPAEGDVDFLLGALAPEGVTPEEWWAGVGLPELQRTIRAAAHADFATGDVADLEGWQLARAEARLAALFTVTRLSG